MSRHPPALLYLTIFNPTLTPTTQPREDDEDAEEQAQILFYTAREHAVSRDRILRQVGLAKALTNFSDMFADEECEDVHSQSRRMIMVSPESGFWIHACLELSKTPRLLPPNKSKEKGKGKAKTKEFNPAPETVFDYHDSTVSDAALRAHLMRGHQLFQLTHGSFTSILSNIGQHALELQLERFFTPWAWSWDIEQDAEFGSYFPLPAHPLYKTLSPLLDEFLSQIALPDTAAPFIIAPPHIVASTAYGNARLSPVLPHYLRKRVHPPSSISAPMSVDSSDPNKDSGSKENEGAVGGATDVIVEGTRDALNATGSAFVAMGNAMDVRRWNWGYLTFGKSAAGNPRAPVDFRPSNEPALDVKPREGEENIVNQPGDVGAEPKEEGNDTPPLGLPEVEVDRESLIEAMANLDVAPLKEPEHTEPERTEPAQTESVSEDKYGAHSDPNTGENDISAALPQPPESQSVDTNSAPDSWPTSASLSTLKSPDSARHPSPLLKLHVHIADPEEAENTLPQHLLYHTREGLTLGFLVDPEDEISDDEMARLSSLSSELLQQVQTVLDEAESGSTPHTPLYSATKILQPKDKFIFTKDRGRVLASIDFVSRSEHLFAAQELVSNTDILEVYSRTQGPQHWHMARREQDGVTFMEVSRKETSLTDVEDELLGVIRRCRDSDTA